MTEENFPTSLNKEVFEKALQNKHKQAVKITDFLITAGSKKGDNYTSDIYRVKVKYEVQGSFKETFLIVKYMIDREEAKKVFIENSIIRKEQEMYEKFLPMMNELLGEKCSPDCFLVMEDPPAFILEDLKANEFDVADRQKGLDLDHCKILLQKLGKFHASSIVLAARQPDIFKNFNEGIFRGSANPDDDFVMDLFGSSIKQVINIAGKWDGFEKIVQKLENISENLREKIFRCVNQKSDIPVLNHGDVWTNNFMFQYKDGSKKPNDVRFVDYQILFYSGLGIDYNYFFFTSPSKEVRDKYEEFLFEVYYQSLSETLKKLKFPKIPAVGQIRNEIRKYEFYAVFAAFSVLPIVSLERDENMDYDMENFNKESDLKNAMYAAQHFHDLLRPILLKLDRDGVLDY